MNLWLSREELCDLTGFKTKSKWREELAKLNVRFRCRSDGFPLVERAQFQQTTTRPQPVRRRTEPNWAN